MNVLITGGGGQLASELVRAAPADVRVTVLSRAQLDISDEAAVRDAAAAAGPQLIVNAAAYTAVDRAETDSDAAFAVNRDGAGNLARAAAAVGARMVHVSTDFVFDGRSAVPYLPTAATHPLGVYGASKLAGEVAVLAAAPDALIVRTAWVYAPAGKNFVTTMLRLMRERPEVRVVADQVGTPTSAATLAEALWRLADKRVSGLLHFTDAGVASWYDFAQAIAEEAHAGGLLPVLPRITPIRTEDYPTPAARPAYSVLDKSATWQALERGGVHWRTALRQALAMMPI